MVVLIQNTQNRDSHALHLKLDELIRADVGARNSLMGLEDLTDHELEELQSEFDELAQHKLDERKRKSAPHERQNGEPKTSSRTTGARSSRAT